MPRDWKLHYKRRTDRGLARGLSLAQARGHARVGEAPAKGQRDASAKRLASAVRQYAKTGQFRETAKAARVAPERLRRELYSGGLIKRVKGRLQRQQRFFRIPTRGRWRELKLDAPNASRAGTFDNAVRTFRGKPDPLLLAPFVGDGVTDVFGRFHPFETDPSTLYELALMEGGTFEQVYQLVTIT